MFKKKNIQKIINGCIAKDTKAQRQFVDQFGDLLYAICIRYLGDRTIAKDALQMSLLKVLNNIHKYDSEKGKLESWITTITINTCLTQRGKSKLEVINIDELKDQEPSVDEIAISELSKQEILALITTLPTLYRQVFNLYVIDGYNHQEIAALIGISEQVSRARLSRAKKQLRSQLSNLKKKRSWIGLA